MARCRCQYREEVKTFGTVAESNLCSSNNFGSSLLRNENSCMDKVYDLVNCTGKKGSRRREVE